MQQNRSICSRTEVNAAGNNDAAGHKDKEWLKDEAGQNNKYIIQLFDKKYPVLLQTYIIAAKASLTLAIVYQLCSLTGQ